MRVKEIFVVMIFSVMAWKSLGLKWTTETLHTSCCEGQDRILMWNCSLEKNETVLNSLWFFQSTQIAYVSGSGKFDVRDLYKGRLEQIGTMGILLKNVSSVDTGNYSLYLNVGPEPPENMQTIFLKVFESQKYQCKPSITKYSENVLFCSAYSCGGIQLSTEWRISEKYDFVSNESYLKINSSWNDEHVSCCLHIQCQNGNLLDVCASTNIFFVEDKYAPDSKSTDNSMNFTAAVVVLAMTNFLSIVICFRCRNKIHRLCAKRCKDTDKVLEPNNEPETRSMIEGTSSETSKTHFYFDARSHLSEGKSSENASTVEVYDLISSTDHLGRSTDMSSIIFFLDWFRLSEDLSSETVRSVHFFADGPRLSEGRSSETSWMNLFHDSLSDLSEGKSSENSSTVEVDDPISTQMI